MPVHVGFEVSQALEHDAIRVARPNPQFTFLMEYTNARNRPSSARLFSNPRPNRPSRRQAVHPPLPCKANDLREQWHAPRLDLKVTLLGIESDKSRRQQAA
jgi:hypothetical protein